MNRHEVRGDIGIIFIDSPTHGTCEILVDAEDLDAILSEYPTWCLSKAGNVLYASSHCNDKDHAGNRIRLHSVIMRKMLRDDRKKWVVDHINGNTFDNRRQNLRVVDRSANAQNSKMLVTNTSGFRNVYWDRPKRKWFAKVIKNGKQIFGTYFDDKESAVREARVLQERYFPFYQCNRG